MLARRYVFPLLILALQLLHVLAMRVSAEVENVVLPEMLVKNASVVPSSKSTPSRPDRQPAITTTHLPFPSQTSHSTPVGHFSASQTFPAPVIQHHSSQDDPILHHPLPSHSSSPSESNSTDVRTHAPFHPHPPPSAPNHHSGSSGPSATQIFFEAFGGFIGLIVLLAIARCIYVYRRTPGSRRPPTPEVGEVERTLALLRPGRTLNLGDRIIPPPPYQPAPNYDSVVASGSGGNASISTQSSTSARTMMNSIPDSISIPNDISTLETSNPASDTFTSTSNINTTSAPRLPEPMPSNATGRPPDVHL